MEILKAVLPVLTVLVIGIVIRKKAIITEEGISGLQSLVMNVTLPVALFANFYKTRLSPAELLFPLTMFTAVVLGLFLGKGICRLLRVNRPIVPFMMSGYEAGMLGFALMTILCGDISTFAMLDIGQDLAIFTVYLALLRDGNGEHQSAKDTVAQMLHTPVLIAIVLGVLIGATGLGPMVADSPAGAVIDAVCTFIAAPTSTVILIVIGYRMKFEQSEFPGALKVCALRFGLQALFTAAILFLFSLAGGVFAEELTTLSVLIMMILPPPFILPLYMEEKQDKEFCSSVLSLYTILTIALYFVLVLFVKG